MAHIPLPDSLLSKLRRTAQNEGLSLTRLFEKMLDFYLESHQAREARKPNNNIVESPHASSDPIYAEVAAFQNLHPELLKNYPNQYVAIYQGRLIDHDADKLALFKRIDATHPNQFVLMRPVLIHPEREFHLRSPRHIERA